MTTITKEERTQIETAFLLMLRAVNQAAARWIEKEALPAHRRAYGVSALEAKGSLVSFFWEGHRARHEPISSFYLMDPDEMKVQALGAQFGADYSGTFLAAREALACIRTRRRDQRAA